MSTVLPSDPSALGNSLVDHERLSTPDLINSLLVYVTTLDLPSEREEVLREQEKLKHYAVCQPALLRIFGEDAVGFELVLKKLSRHLGITHQAVRADMEALVAVEQRARSTSVRPAGAGNSCPYKEASDGIVWLKLTRVGEVEIPLTNFRARIMTECTEDDGAEYRKVFEIEAWQDGQRVVTTIAAKAFPAMTWVTDALGAKGWLAPGPAVRDHVRSAIQLLSQGTVVERHVYQHTGWRHLNGVWVYLHGAGAIGPNGMVPGINVQLPSSLERYVLPTPPQGQVLLDAVRASMRVLSLVPARVAYPSYAAVWRAPLGDSDSSLFLYGKSGKGKSEWAAICQQHFGAGMVRLNLPGSFLSTGNLLESLAFQTKDALFVIDDFCPTGSLADVQRAHREADRIFRAQGNHAGRGRLTSTATQRVAKPPRGLLLGTGEDLPRGYSIRARLFTVAINEGDLDWAKLTACQQDAADGLYAQAMAGFLQWLAPRYEAIKAGLKAEVQELRTRALQGAHRRTAELIANLAIGMRYFLQFATGIGAISPSEREKLWQSAWEALGEAAQAQAYLLGEADPARRFIELLTSAIASGEAHLANPEGWRPDDPQAWGWRDTTGDTVESVFAKWHPQGKRIGWVEGENLYLEPNAAFGVAQSLGTRQGDALSVTGQTLRARLKDSGYLLSWDHTRQRNTVRRTIEGRAGMEVLHLSSRIFTQTNASPSDTPSKPSTDDTKSSLAGEKNGDPNQLGDSSPSPGKTLEETELPWPMDGLDGILREES